MPTTEAYIRDTVRKIVDPLITRFRQDLYGSGVSYNTSISRNVIPDSFVEENEIDGLVTAAGFIKGIKTYISGVLQGSNQKELNFVNLDIAVAGDRTTITRNYTYGSGVPRIAAGWFFADALTVGSGRTDIPVQQFDANVTISGLWGNVPYVVPTATSTFDVAWSTDLTSWSSIYSVKPTFTSGNRALNQGTLSKTTFALNDYVRLDVVSLNGVSLSGVTFQLRVVGR